MSSSRAILPSAETVMRIALSSPVNANMFRLCAVRSRFLLVALMALTVDLLSKQWAFVSLGEYGFITLTDRLVLMLVFNTGGAGGVELSPLGWQLSMVVTLFAMALIMTVLRPMASVDPRAVTALGLVSGGAAGNLASMVVGPAGVADFIGMRLSRDMTIVANVADFALWIGALMLIPVGMTLVRMVRDERARHAVRSLA